MGFIFLGIASLNLIGLTGAVLIMVAHGFLAALTFALSGYIYQQTGTLKMSELGGLCRQLPFIGTALLMAAMAGCGLPGFANFVGEVTVFFGAWSQPSLRVVTALAVWVALLIGALLSFVTLGRMRGFNRDTVLRFTNECLAPTAAITLLVGAGGGFGRVLQDSGVSQAIIAVAVNSHIPLLLLAWLLAALMRLATGSATVAMSTAASIVAPIALVTTGVHPELLAIATGAGSLIFSHVNDGGFWLVKEYFNMSVVDTIKTWSVCETIVAVAGLMFTAALSYVV